MIQDAITAAATWDGKYGDAQTCNSGDENPNGDSYSGGSNDDFSDDGSEYVNLRRKSALKAVNGDIESLNDYSNNENQNDDNDNGCNNYNVSSDSSECVKRRRKSALEAMNEDIESLNDEISTSKYAPCNLTKDVLLTTPREDGTLYEEENFCDLCKHNFGKILKVKHHPIAVSIPCTDE